MKKILVDRCLTEVSTVSPLAFRNIMNMDVETVNPTTAMVRTAFFLFSWNKRPVNVKQKLKTYAGN